MKSVGAVAQFSKILTSEILQSQTQRIIKLKESCMKSTLRMQYLGPRVPNFRPFHPTITRVQDIYYTF